MKQKDLELVRAEIQKSLQENKEWESFNCPNCKHGTIAEKVFWVDWSLYTTPSKGVTIPNDRQWWRERRCLVCGKLFRQSCPKIEWAEIDDKVKSTT